MITYPEHIKKALEELADKGFAIAIFTPKELNGVDPEIVTEDMTIEGWNCIHINKDPNTPDFNWEDETEEYPK